MFFANTQPSQVYLAAAKVGGIHANATYPAEFISDNLNIQANVIDAAWRNGCKKLLFLGSSCIYPRDAPQPMTEDALLTGPLEPTNQWYAVAKIAGIKLCQAYRQQYGFNAICVMPTNLYGPNDHFDDINAHVVPSLMSKLYRAALNGDKVVTLWGSGKPRRELLHVDDLADALITLMAEYDDAKPVNVGSGQEVTIAELAHMVAEVVGYKGDIRFDSTHPDGPPRKLLDTSRIARLWQPKISLYDGLCSTFNWYATQLGSTGPGGRVLHQLRA